MRMLGLARTPPRIAGLLSASAAACARAAADLAAVGGAVAVPKEAGEAQRLAREAALAAGEMLGGGLDRSDVLSIAEALRAAAERIAEAAHADPPAGPALTGVLRDSARALAGAVQRLDGPRRERDALLDRVEELHLEGRGLVRAARAEVLTRPADPVAAVKAEESLARLDRALRASRRAARAVRHVVVKHA